MKEWIDDTRKYGVTLISKSLFGGKKRQIDVKGRERRRVRGSQEQTSEMCVSHCVWIKQNPPNWEDARKK